MKKKKRKKYKLLLYILLLVIIAITLMGIYIRNTLFKPIDLDKNVYIYITNSTSYNEVVTQIKEKIELPSEKLFELLAERMNYPQQVKTGRYAIKNKMTMLKIIRTLRSGKQTPVKLTFNNIRTKENLAGRISQQLMIDSLSLLSVLRNEIQIEGFDTTTIVAMFIPNTYEVYWNISINNLLDRMKKEYNRFWNKTRISKAEILGLSPLQVSILASIVEEEATYADEYPIVAGLYINRLKRGMRLEADPTVKYALGNFSLQRILFKHLEVESPYNTYQNSGLPPGPIRIPSISAIDATLSPTSHKYLFMCAKEDLSGRHNFSTTHAEHARNAARYQKALNERKIYK